MHCHRNSDALALITNRGFTIGELFPDLTGLDLGTGRKTRKAADSTDGRSSVPPKYRNPDNSAETWTGRGRKPKWVVAKLAEGGGVGEF